MTPTPMNNPSPRPNPRASHSITDINTVLRSGGIHPITQHELAMLGAQIDVVRFNTTLAAIRGPNSMTRDRAIRFMREVIEKARVAIAGGGEIPASPWPDLSPKAVEFSNLRDVNATLHSLGLPRLRPEHVDPLLKAYGRTEILRLMNLAVAGGETGEQATTTLRSMLHEVLQEASGAARAPSTAEVRPLHAAPRTAADEIPDGVDPAPDADRPHAASRATPQTTAAPRPRDSVPPSAPRHQSLPARHAVQPATEAVAPERSAPARVQCKAYGNRAAITVETAETEAGIPTVRFEFAPVLGNAHAGEDDGATTDRPGKTYDWSKKLIIQLTADEVPQLLAVLYGFAAGAQFSNHGPTKVKWMSLENQDKCIYMRAGDKDVPIMVLPVSSPHAIVQIANIAMLVARKRYGALTADDLRVLVKNQVAVRIKPVPANRTGTR